MNPLEKCGADWGPELSAGFLRLVRRPITVRDLSLACQSSAGEAARRHALRGQFPGLLIDAWRQGVSQRDIHTLLNSGRGGIMVASSAPRGRTAALLFTAEEAVALIILWRLSRMLTLPPVLRQNIIRTLDPQIIRRVAMEGEDLQLVFMAPEAVVFTALETREAEHWSGLPAVRLPPLVFDSVRGLLSN